MKHVITSLVLLMATMGFSQSNLIDEQFKIHSSNITGLDIAVNVNNAEEVASTFNLKDMKKILNEIKIGEDVTFKITCNETLNNSKNVGRKLSYKVNGNTKDVDGLLASIEKIRNSAITFYRNK